MKKKYNTQKKKTTTNSIIRTLTKILIGVIIVFIILIIFLSVNFSSSLFNLSSRKSGEINKHTPSDLRWFNDFKGVENVKDKNSNNNSSGNSGFRYEGFNK